MSAEEDTTAGDDDGKNVEEENQTEYEPVVHLKPVSVDSGERDEDQIYKQRCALYRYVAATEKDPAQWKERGRGDIRMLQHKTNKMVRVVLREEKTLKLRCNHVVHPRISLKPNEGSDRFWAWRTEDYAEDPPVTETFGIKFKTAEIANEFKAKWDDARKTNDAAIAKKAPSGAASGGAAGSSVAASSVGGGADVKDSKTPAASAAAGSAAAPSAVASAASAKSPDPAVERLATAVAGVTLNANTQHDDLWAKIIAERKFAPLTQDDIKKLWTSFDTNNDGKIDVPELKALLSALLRAVLKQLQVPITEDVQKKMESELPGLVDKALQRLDSNKDGHISFEEFKALDTVKMVSSK